MRVDKNGVLVIAYWFAPMQGMGVQRSVANYRKLKEEFQKVLVLTSSNRHLVKQDEYFYDEGDVHEVFAADYRYFHSKILNSKDNTKANQIKEKSVYRFLSRLAQSFPFHFIFGEGNISYIMNAYLYASKLIHKESISSVYSSYSPIADHVIAFLLKLRYPHLNWTADFRDLHVDTFRKNTIFPRFQKSIDRIIFSKADRITTVSKGLKENLSFLKKDIEVIHNNHPIELSERINKKSSTKLILSYTGTIYPWQDLNPLFNAIKYLDPERTELWYAGRSADIWDKLINRAGLEEISFNFDLINHKRSLLMQQMADINILATWNQPGSSGVLTGKLFEYTKAGKPILAICNGPEDSEMREILEGSNVDFIIYSMASSEDILVDFVRDYIIQKFNKEEVPELAVRKS